MDTVNYFAIIITVICFFGEHMTVNLHNSEEFLGRGRKRLFLRSSSVRNPKALVFIVHGLGEHSGRYTRLTDSLGSIGMSVYSFDLPGHGKSTGRRGHASNLSVYHDSLTDVIKRASESHPDRPLFLFGHSLGALVAFIYALDHPDLFQGLVLSSPPFRPLKASGFFHKRIISSMSSLLPFVTVSNRIKPSELTHDEEAIDIFENDYLVHNRVSFRLASLINKKARECLDRAGALAIPLLIVHGREDAVADYRGSEEVVRKVVFPDSELVIYDCLFHETLNEIQKERSAVLKKITDWFQEKLAQKSGCGQVQEGTSAAHQMKEVPAADEGKKPAVKKAAAKKASTKKAAAAKKPAVKKASAKKAASKKAAAKKPAVKKAPAKKPAAKKASAKKTSAKKPAVKKTASKKASSKKTSKKS